MRPPALEEIAKYRDAIGDVEIPIAVKVHAAGTNRTVLSQEQVAENSYPITDINARILVEVTGDLAPAGNAESR